MRGITHALSAGAAAATVATYRWHQSAALAATTTAIASGAGTEPDVDQPGSSIARAFGPITEALAWAVRRARGGHREGTHTAAGNGICAGLAAAAIALESWRPHLHLRGATLSVPVGQVMLGAYLALLFAAGMGALRWPRRTSRRRAAATCAAAAIAVTGWDAAGIAWAIFIGAAAHCAGDALTKDGDAWLAPFTPHRFHLLPPGLRITTGGAAERRLITPAAAGALAWMACLTLIAPHLGSR